MYDLKTIGFYAIFGANTLICLRILGWFDAKGAVLSAPGWQVVGLCLLSLGMAGFSAWLIHSGPHGKEFRQGAIAFGAALPALFVGLFLWVYLTRL